MCQKLSYQTGYQYYNQAHCVWPLFTVSSDGEDVEDSGEDASKSWSRTSAEPESILSQLKARSQQFEQYGRLSVEPGLDYFLTKFTQDLSDSVAAFKVACLFVPQKVAEMQPNANAINDLAVFPFLNDIALLSQLKVELPEYLVKAEDVSANMAPLEWWDRQEYSLPHWSASVRN